MQSTRAWPGRMCIDDGDDRAAARLAESLGFEYGSGPTAVEPKKSGNMRFAFAGHVGEFFVVLDAEFRPRDDFWTETRPYFDDPEPAIVQTPQYSARTRSNRVERAAGPSSRRFSTGHQGVAEPAGESICVGTALSTADRTRAVRRATPSHTAEDDPHRPDRPPGRRGPWSSAGSS